MENSDLELIKAAVEEFLGKMTVGFLSVKVLPSFVAGDAPREGVEVELVLQDPQMLIGHNGQTLFELSRLLRIILNKKLQTLRPGSGREDFYVNVDINDYKKKKLDYLKDLARAAAAEVLAIGEKKILPAMPAYERRVIHAELSGRPDVKTESFGEGLERSVVISIK